MFIWVNPLAVVSAYAWGPGTTRLHLLVSKLFCAKAVRCLVFPLCTGNELDVLSPAQQQTIVCRARRSRAFPSTLVRADRVRSSARRDCAFSSRFAAGKTKKQKRAAMTTENENTICSPESEVALFPRAPSNRAVQVASYTCSGRLLRAPSVTL